MVKGRTRGANEQSHGKLPVRHRHCFGSLVTSTLGSDESSCSEARMAANKDSTIVAFIYLASFKAHRANIIAGSEG